MLRLRPASGATRTGAVPRGLVGLARIVTVICAVAMAGRAPESPCGVDHPGCLS